jgi:hypothetical protein
MQWRPPSCPSALRWAAVLCCLVAGGPVASAQSAWAPTGAWLQAGSADETQTLTAGLVWDWSWQRALGRGVISGYWEASIGRWHSNEETGSSSYWVTQVGITPTLRWQPGSWPEGLLLEVGIGLNSLVPIYRSGDKHFSTAFNFGDHIALVKQFGERRREELALRFQHYSNAGIRHPNPGENFVQLRYTHRF